MQDDRISSVEDFEFTVNKKKVLTTFTVVSIFGELKTETEVEILCMRILLMMFSWPNAGKSPVCKQ